MSQILLRQPGVLAQPSDPLAERAQVLALDSLRGRSIMIDARKRISG